MLFHIIAKLKFFIVIAHLVFSTAGPLSLRGIRNSTKAPEYGA